MPKHPFHQTIGELVGQLTFPPGTDYRTAPECGGPNRIPLLHTDRSKCVQFCLVDLLIIQPDKAVVIEIEESDVKPLHLFGKFYASAFSTDFNGQDISELPLLFIQVLDTSNVNLEKGKKGQQWERVKGILKDQANGWPDRQVQYELLVGGQDDFKTGSVESEKLLGLIRGFLDEDESPSKFDESDSPDGLRIHVRASLGGEQTFLLTDHVLTYQSDCPIYKWAGGQVQLSSEQVVSVYALLDKVRIGPMPNEPTIGLDGETTAVTISQGQNRVELEYWDAPKAWKSLDKLIQMMRRIASEVSGIELSD